MHSIILNKDISTDLFQNFYYVPLAISASASHHLNATLVV